MRAGQSQYAHTLRGRGALPIRGLEKIMRNLGTVKFYNTDKGFGFIAPEDGGRDVFVHATAVQKAGIPYLEQDMKISFDVVDDAKGRGLQAVQLQLEKDRTV
jgi:cold shock protein